MGKTFALCLILMVEQTSGKKCSVQLKADLAVAHFLLSRFLAGFPEPYFFPEQRRGPMSSFSSKYVHFCVALPAAEGSS